MHIDVSRAYLHAKAQRLVLVRLPVENRLGTDAWKIGLLKKSMYGTRDAASNGERDWQEHVESWRFNLAQLEESRRDTALQPHFESTHTKAKDHCKKQRRNRFAAAVGASESKGLVSFLKDLGYEM